MVGVKNKNTNSWWAPFHPSMKHQGAQRWHWMPAGQPQSCVISLPRGMQKGVIYTRRISHSTIIMPQPSMIPALSQMSRKPTLSPCSGSPWDLYFFDKFDELLSFLAEVPELLLVALLFLSPALWARAANPAVDVSPPDFALREVSHLMFFAVSVSLWTFHTWVLWILALSPFVIGFGMIASVNGLTMKMHYRNVLGYWKKYCFFGWWIDMFGPLKRIRALYLWHDWERRSSSPLISWTSVALVWTVEIQTSLRINTCCRLPPCLQAYIANKNATTLNRLQEAVSDCSSMLNHPSFRSFTWF